MALSPPGKWLSFWRDLPVGLYRNSLSPYQTSTNCTGIIGWRDTSNDVRGKLNHLAHHSRASPVHSEVFFGRSLQFFHE